MYRHLPSAPAMSTTCLLDAASFSQQQQQNNTGQIQLFRLTRSCAKTSIAIPLLPFSSPILWLLPQSYTKKHQLYRLRVLNRGGVVVQHILYLSRVYGRLTRMQRKGLVISVYCFCGNILDRLKKQGKRRRRLCLSENAFLMSCNNALTPTTSTLCRESHPNFLHP